MRAKFLLVILFCFLSATAIVLMSCNQNNGSDDDSDGNNNNGWTDDGCEYTYNGDQPQKPSLSQPKDGFEDCVPELPEDVDPEPLLAILEIYLGNYVDNNSAARTIECRPDGTWEVPHIIPNTICDHHWLIPIWVTFNDDGTTVKGALYQQYFKAEKIPDPTSWPEATVYVDPRYINPNGFGAEAKKGWSPEDALQWLFYYPEEWKEIIWTKAD